MPRTEKTIIVTGGAGYIGAHLVARLLEIGCRVHAIDALLYGGDSLLAFFHHPRFSFSRSNLIEGDFTLPSTSDVDAVIHLAAISGFPACQVIGRDVAWKFNVDATIKLLRWAHDRGIPRFIFSSTYSAYGSEDDRDLISETSPQNPQTVYAETKIQAEEAIQSYTNHYGGSTILRICDVFGISPRTRFDLLGNQFIWNAISKREITVFQRNFQRCLIHISDVINGILCVVFAPDHLVSNETFILGNPSNHLTKEDLAQVVAELIPGVRILHKDITFGGYRRNFKIDSTKMTESLGFIPTCSVHKGLIEVRDAISQFVIRDPSSDFHHNARFPVI